MDYKDDFVWREKQTSLEHWDAPPQCTHDTLAVVCKDDGVFVMPYTEGYQAIPRITFRRTLYIEDDVVVFAETETVSGGFWLSLFDNDESVIVVFDEYAPENSVTEQIRDQIKAVMNL